MVCSVLRLFCLILVLVFGCSFVSTISMAGGSRFGLPFAFYTSSILPPIPGGESNAARVVSSFDGIMLLLDLLCFLLFSAMIIVVRERLRGVREKTAPQVLTAEIAAQFLADEGSVELAEFTEIEDAAAEAFSRHRGELSLNGLIMLSDAAAEALSRHEDGLKTNEQIRGKLLAACAGEKRQDLAQAEKKPSRSIRPLFDSAIVLGTAAAILLYAFTFDRFSETALVRLSYFWAPLLAFGFTGRIATAKAAENPTRIAMFAAVGSAIALTFFYELIFSGL